MNFSARVLIIDRLLPTPIFTPQEEETVFVQPKQSQPQQQVILRDGIPAYGQRAEWKPSKPEDYGAPRFSLICVHKLIRILS